MIYFNCNFGHVEKNVQKKFYKQSILQTLKNQNRELFDRLLVDKLNGLDTWIELTEIEKCIPETPKKRVSTNLVYLKCGSYKKLISQNYDMNGLNGIELKLHITDLLENSSLSLPQYEELNGIVYELSYKDLFSSINIFEVTYEEI